ncbi:Uncharacterised protein [Legionella beliardensis]|uniref:Dot/Icm T4SS effector n=1 Tax=Legionella beliardensis TaxID=91822 RepID=A0A378HZS4_9GAMM|nr:hypothetical protein [Legionella beliardensis]STX27796.1 Uncharacterised protein [Legionella beliardensis]
MQLGPYWCEEQRLWVRFSVQDDKSCVAEVANSKKDDLSTTTPWTRAETDFWAVSAELLPPGQDVKDYSIIDVNYGFCLRDGTLYRTDWHRSPYIRENQFEMGYLDGDQFKRINPNQLGAADPFANQAAPESVKHTLSELPCTPEMQVAQQAAQQERWQSWKQSAARSSLINQVILTSDLPELEEKLTTLADARGVLYSYCGSEIAGLLDPNLYDDFSRYLAKLEEISDERSDLYQGLIHIASQTAFDRETALNPGNQNANLKQHLYLSKLNYFLDLIAAERENLLACLHLPITPLDYVMPEIRSPRIALATDRKENGEDEHDWVSDLSEEEQLELVIAQSLQAETITREQWLARKEYGEPFIEENYDRDSFLANTDDLSEDQFISSPLSTRHEPDSSLLHDLDEEEQVRIAKARSLRDQEYERDEKTSTGQSFYSQSSSEDEESFSSSDDDLPSHSSIARIREEEPRVRDNLHSSQEWQNRIYTEQRLTSAYTMASNFPKPENHESSRPFFFPEAVTPEKEDEESLSSSDDDLSGNSSEEEDIESRVFSHLGEESEYDAALGAELHHERNESVPQAVIDESTLLAIKNAVNMAVTNYQDWYNADSSAHHDNKYFRGPHGFFSKLFFHGMTGQKRADDLNKQIQEVENKDEIIGMINTFLCDPNRRYRGHSFSSFLLDQLSQLPEELPWHGLEPSPGTNHYSQAEVIERLAEKNIYSST